MSGGGGGGITVGNRARMIYQAILAYYRCIGILRGS